MKVKLSTVCDLLNGYAFSSKDYIEKSNTFNCRMSNIRPDASFDIYHNVKYLPDEYAKKYSNYLLNDNDLIIAMTDMAGDPKILGVPATVITNGKKILLNQRVGKITIKDKNILNSEYLKYALSYKKNKEYYKQFAKGGVQLNISKPDILSLEINVPSIEKQKDIVNKLNQLKQIINNRKNQINHLENLLSSKFFEEFGNPYENPNNYSVMTLNDVCSSIVRGPFGSSLKKDFFVEKGPNTYKVYEQKHAINENAFIGDYYIDESKFHELKRFECKTGDIIMTCSGTLGKLYILPENIEKGIINQALCKFSLNDKVTPNYFLNFMKNTIDRLDTKGSSIKNIGAVSFIKNMTILVPPIEIQKEYESFNNIINRTILNLKDNLTFLENLYEKKMYEFFD